MFTHFLLDGADSDGGGANIPSGGASLRSEVNKTDVNHALGKLISNLSLNRSTSARPFSEGGEPEKYICRRLLGQSLSTSWRTCQYRVAQCVGQPLCDVCVLFGRRSKLG